MIGLQFLLRVVQFMFYFALAGLLLISVAAIVNLTVQFVGEMLGYEVGNLFSWIKNKLPKFKKG